MAKKNYRFTGREGAFMKASLLKKFIQRHEKHHEVHAHFFGKEILMNVLNRPGCVGIRFYHAIDDKGNKTLVLVGTNEKGVNLWSRIKLAKGKRGDPPPSGAADTSKPCPPYC